VVQQGVVFVPQETALLGTQVQTVPLWQEKRRTQRDLKSPAERPKRSESRPFLYPASLHNNRYGIRNSGWSYQYKDGEELRGDIDQWQSGSPSPYLYPWEPEKLASLKEQLENYPFDKGRANTNET